MSDKRDPQLGRFWRHRGEDGMDGISESDWTIFLKHADATLRAFNVPQAEYDEVVAFVLSTKADIVEL